MPKTVPLRDLLVSPDLLRMVPRPAPEDRAALKAGLAEDGQRIPLAVLPDLTIVDGHTRFELMQELGIGRARVEVVGPFSSRAELLEYALDVNRERRQLNHFQLVRLAEGYEEVATLRAGERKTAGARRGGSRGNVAGSQSQGRWRRAERGRRSARLREPHPPKPKTEPDSGEPRTHSSRWRRRAPVTRQ